MVLGYGNERYESIHVTTMQINEDFISIYITWLMLRTNPEHGYILNRCQTVISKQEP